MSISKLCNISEYFPVLCSKKIFFTKKPRGIDLNIGRCYNNVDISLGDTAMSNKEKNYKLTKCACYFSNITNAAAFGLPPLLFVTFRELYGISYTLLGTLVLINFLTQLTVDLIFTFFAKYFDPHRSLRAMPLLTTVGMTVYALVPTFFPQYAYIGLVIGTVIFSVSAGLCEVLISPTVAALPSDTPDRDMSMLHSLYAWGVLSVVVISTVFLRIFGTVNWMYLILFFAALPMISLYLFCTAPLPEMELTHKPNEGEKGRRGFGLALCTLCIFLGSAAECTMTNWISGFMETALQIPKMTGDILGMAAFALLLGTARILYAKYGKSIERIMLISMICSAVCYLTVGLSQDPTLSMIACVLTGFTTAMLWPGTLILMEEKFVGVGITAYALMAAGGDFGGMLAPQLMGIIVDTVAESELAISLGGTLSLTPEQVGMKAGMLISAVFPILGALLLVYMIRYFKKHPAPLAK